MTERLTFQRLEVAVKRKGYVWFETGHYNLNIIGIRNQQSLNADVFNDSLCVAFYVNGHASFYVFPITTDPGAYYRKHPLSKDGVAIVAPGQYRGVWHIGRHQNQYAALVQRKPITVIRDNDGDSALDFNAERSTGLYGINCHRSIADGISTTVSKWSAGCQVFSSSADFNWFMGLCRRAKHEWSNSFTYTLLESSDL